MICNCEQLTPGIDHNLLSFLKMATNSNTFFPSFMTTFPISSLFHLLINSTHIKLEGLLAGLMHHDTINILSTYISMQFKQMYMHTCIYKKTVDLGPEHGLNTGIKIFCQNYFFITHIIQWKIYSNNIKISGYLAVWPGHNGIPTVIRPISSKETTTN